MSDVLDIRVHPGDRAGYDRLRRIVNLQDASDRVARWRRAWTAAVALASIPLALVAAQRPSGRPLAGWALSLWTTALLAAIGSALREWQLRRRLRLVVAAAGDATAAVD